MIPKWHDTVLSWNTKLREKFYEKETFRAFENTKANFFTIEEYKAK